MGAFWQATDLVLYSDRKASNFKTMDATTTTTSAVSSSFPGQACPCASRMELDLRVTKESRHNAPDPTMPTPTPSKFLHQPFTLQSPSPPPQEYPKEWSFRRDEVPYSLAQRGMTLTDWMNVFDRADALWERRIMELREVVPATTTTWERVANAAIFVVIFNLSYYGFSFLYTWTDSSSASDVLLLYFGCVLLGCFGAIGFVLIGQTTGQGFDFYSPKCFETLATLEDDWSCLADAQRRRFESLGVDVVPIKEVTKTKGRCHVWTVGLRFSFDMPTMISQHTENSALPILSDSPTQDVDAIQDLDRLLQLNQIGDVETEEYQRLMLRILSKMSLPCQYEALSKKTGPGASAPATATTPTVPVHTDNNDADVDKKQVRMEIV